MVADARVSRAAVVLLMLLVFVIAGLVVRGCAGRSRFIETFDGGAAGWAVAGDAQKDLGEPVLRREGGAPGAHLEAVDDTVGGVWYWVAPEAFLQVFASIAKRRPQAKLVFDLKVSDASAPFDDSDVILTGAGHELEFDTAENPGLEWTSYEVPLNGDGWRHKNEGRPATHDELRAAIEGLESLWIRGEFQTGPDVGWIDNVGIR